MNKPITGIAILEKVDRDAETMTEKAIHPSDAAYQVLQQKGILAALKAVPDLYLERNHQKLYVKIRILKYKMYYKEGF